MRKSETKGEPQDMSVYERAHTVTYFHWMEELISYSAVFRICVLSTAGVKLARRHIYNVHKCFKSSEQTCRGLSLHFSHTDGSNHMFLSFENCPGGDVCKGLPESEHSINASQLLYNSVYLSVTVLNSVYQGVRLSCTFSACFWYREKMACLRDILTAFKRCIKKPCDRFINAINCNWFLCIPAFYVPIWTV